MRIWLKCKELIFSLAQLFSRKNKSPFEELLPYARPTQDHRIYIRFKTDNVPEAYTVQEFERLMGVTYARHLVFRSESIYLLVKELCKNVFDQGEVSKGSEWLGVFFRNQIDTGDVKKVSIRYVDDHIGFGVFLEEKIAKGDMIGEYTGLVRRCLPIFSLPNRYSFRYPLYCLFFGSYTIDAEEFTNEISFINHSKSPNCESVVSINHHLLHVVIRAARDLEQGEELTFDYGTNLEEML